MNSKVEKWLTIGASVVWVASMGSLTLLALRAAVPSALLPRFAPAASAESLRSTNFPQKLVRGNGLFSNQKQVPIKEKFLNRASGTVSPSRSTSPESKGAPSSLIPER